nr:E3 ubiquitin-protein ligase KEG [Tanacetum cinerariifolium]
ADPNAVDDEGESVLHRAVTKKYTECAIVILENGGCKSMGILNSKNLTPLHLCVTSWNVAVVKRWIEVASSEDIAEAIDVPSPVGTALSMAAAIKKEHEANGRELVQILLAAGADATAQDTQHGRTALHTAAMTNDVELVKVGQLASVLCSTECVRITHDNNNHTKNIVRLRWFGHVRRRPKSALVRRVEALVVDGLRRRGRPKLRWEDRVKHDMNELLLSEDMTSDRNK